MKVRFTASGIVAMILFIPLLLALGLILAFIVPILAIMVAVAGIAFTAVYVRAKMGMIKKQSIGGQPEKSQKKGKAKAIDVKDYRIK